jgi:hypothetical protein
MSTSSYTKKCFPRTLAQQIQLTGRPKVYIRQFGVSVLYVS